MAFLNLRNAETHEFNPIGEHNEGYCIKCGLKMWNNYYDDIFVDDHEDLSCDEFIIKNILE